MQGAFKFGGYEFWKKTFIDAIGIDAARENRTAIYLGSSAIAEFFADVALCPLEATRIRLVSQPGFASGLGSGFARILKEEGVIKGFYSGFGKYTHVILMALIFLKVAMDGFINTLKNTQALSCSSKFPTPWPSSLSTKRLLKLSMLL